MPRRLTSTGVQALAEAARIRGGATSHCTTAWALITAPDQDPGVDTHGANGQRCGYGSRQQPQVTTITASTHDRLLGTLLAVRKM
jgi:hypothetical protein